VEIPEDIHIVRERSPQDAAEWRARTRRAFVWYLRRGYRVAAFSRDPATGRCYYGLTGAAAQPR